MLPGFMSRTPNETTPPNVSGSAPNGNSSPAHQYFCNLNNASNLHCFVRSSAQDTSLKNVLLCYTDILQKWKPTTWLMPFLKVNLFHFSSVVIQFVFAYFLVRTFILEATGSTSGDGKRKTYWTEWEGASSRHFETPYSRLYGMVSLSVMFLCSVLQADVRRGTWIKPLIISSCSTLKIVSLKLIRCFY